MDQFLHIMITWHVKNTFSAMTLLSSNPIRQQGPMGQSSYKIGNGVKKKKKKKHGFQLFSMTFKQARQTNDSRCDQGVIKFSNL